MNVENLIAFGEKVQNLRPQDAVQFMNDHSLNVCEVVAVAGLSRQSPYNWLIRNVKPRVENWQAFQQALIAVAHDRTLIPRRIALNADPVLSRDLRWLVELAVSHGELSEASAAAMLGLGFEAWNALPPLGKESL